MIKVLLLCIFISAILASPHWTGKWLTIGTSGPVDGAPGQCDVPLNDTIATVAIEHHRFVLRGISNNTHHKKTWHLGLNASNYQESELSDCDEDLNCVAGFRHNGTEAGTYLQILWWKAEYYLCSAIFVPADTVLGHESDTHQGSSLNNEEEPFSQELIAGEPWFF